MNWAERRRFIILLIVGAVVAAFVATILIATFSKTPTCSDGIQNQDETGIDCGGGCAYLCTAQQLPPTVLFTKALSAAAGRTDVIASIENKNLSAAAKGVPYRVTLFGAGQALIQEVTGQIDLPPGATVPVFIPNITSGKQKVTNAFLSIDASALKWFSMAASSRSMPIVSMIQQGGTVNAPRITAVLDNPTITAFNSVRTVVIVHNDTNEIIAASATILPSIPAEGQATATFTWNNAFSGTTTAVAVVPIIPLP